MTPRLKKPDPDPANARSYRPISSLSVESKVLERLVAKRRLSYLTLSSLMPSLQSAYRLHHSTKTAVLRVLADIFACSGSRRFRRSGIVRSVGCSWHRRSRDIASSARVLIRYPRHGAQLAKIISQRSDTARSFWINQFATCCVALWRTPSTSVLRPILFLLYTTDLIGLVTRHGLCTHLCADDTQVYGFCSPSKPDGLQSQLSTCVEDIAKWMGANRLQLNANDAIFDRCRSNRIGVYISRGSKILGTLNPAPLGQGRGCASGNTPLPRVLPYQIWSLCQTIYGIRRGPKKFGGRWATVTLRRGRGWHQETRSFPMYVTIPNLVALGQTVRA